MKVIYPDKVTGLTPSSTPLTGTITLTNGGNALLGVGTSFTTELTSQQGDQIYLDADGVIVEVDVVATDLLASLTANYTGAGGSGPGSIYEEKALFPKENVSDDHPKKPWKSVSDDATMHVAVSGGSNAIAIFATNAETITVTVMNDIETITLWGPEIYDLQGIDTYYELITDTGERWYVLWVDYPYQANPVSIVVDFESPSATRVGIIRAGATYTFPDPRWGLSEGLVDYSIIKELSNGATYIRKRDIVRKFDGDITMVRDRDFYKFMHKVIKTKGPGPLAWKVSTNLSNFDWAVFARPQNMPRGSHTFPAWSRVNFQLLEVV